MDNMYLPPGGPQDPNQSFGTGPTWPATVGMTSQQSPQEQPPRRRRGRAARWTAIGVAAAALLGGGAVALAAVSGTPAPVTAGAPTGQAAQLSNVLGAAGSNTADAALTSSSAAQVTGAHGKFLARCARLVARLRQAGHPRAAKVVRRFCTRRLLRLRLLGGLHGQFTFRTKKGVRTLAYERGVIQSVSSTAVVVRSSDGTTWTWSLVSKTIVREGGKRTSNSALTAGEHVFAAGPVIGSANDARLILIADSGGASG